MDVTYPAVAPNNALPTKPKGPVNAPIIAPMPIFLAPFLSFLIFSSENTPPSPNNEPWNISEFLANPNAEPASIPPRGPRGVINPAIAPPRPNFLISGTAFIISLLIRPSSCLITFPFSST